MSTLFFLISVSTRTLSHLTHLASCPPVPWLLLYFTSPTRSSPSSKPLKSLWLCTPFPSSQASTVLWFLVNWLHSYLINRSQSVILNGISSSSKHVSSGVSQSSILGPLLFLLYINGVTNIPLSPNSHLILYADDIFLFKPVDSPYDFSLLQSNLNSVSSWLSAKLLTLNISKSKYMLFSLKPSPLIDSLPSLTISSNHLQCVSSFHHLSVTLTPSLSWSLHISNVRSKSRKVLWPHV